MIREETREAIEGLVQNIVTLLINDIELYHERTKPAEEQPDFTLSWYNYMDSIERHYRGDGLNQFFNYVFYSREGLKLNGPAAFNASMEEGTIRDSQVAAAALKYYSQ